MSDSERQYLDALRLVRVNLSAWVKELDDLSKRIDAAWVHVAQVERDRQLALDFERSVGELF